MPKVKEWERRAIEHLAMLPIRQQAVQGMQIKAQMAPSLADRKVIEKERAQLLKLIKHTERALDQLPEQGKRVLLLMYSGHLAPGAAVIKAEEELHCGRSEVYRIRERAIVEFAQRMGEMR